MDDSQPKSGPIAPRARRLRRALGVLVVLELVGVLAVWALIRFASDRWWPATVLLFGPRWIWGTPVILLAPAALTLERRLLAPLAIAALVVVVPLMGLELRLPPRGAPPPLAAKAGEKRLRLMTYNIGDAEPEPQKLLEVLHEVSADVVLFQECQSGGFYQMLSLHHEEYRIYVHGELCVLTRFPLANVAFESRADIEDINGTGGMMRYEVSAPWGTVHIVNVHLATVREGLSAVMHQGLRGAAELEENTRTRSAESALARRWVDATPGPLLVAGDFNMPADGGIYRRDWASFPSAFAEKGGGFGTSKVTRWFGIRIDHVLLGDGWVCDRAFVGPHIDGDHRPIVADLLYTGPLGR